MKRVPNRFAIVNLAAKRVRQIREGSEYLVSSPKNEDIVVALREIAAGKVVFEDTTPPEIVSEPEPEVTEEKATEEKQLEAPAPAEATSDPEPATEEVATEKAEPTVDETPVEAD